MMPCGKGWAFIYAIRMVKNFIILLLSLLCAESWANQLSLKSIELPDGFHIELYAYPVAKARQMALGKDGVVFVGSDENVYAIIPNQKRTKAKQIKVIAKKLYMPRGVAYKDGSLYIGEIHRILRIKEIDDLSKPLKPFVFLDGLPNKAHHGTKYIKFGPDGHLYFQIGAPCNTCLERKKYFASILKINPKDKDLIYVARGVRSNVGLDWDPRTNELWFTENGRDWMGDDAPPDELNHVTQEGQHYGFPFVHGKNFADPYFGSFRDHSDFVKPAWELPAHVAPLGMTFYTGNTFPKKYHHQIIIAEHGSWNRSTKVGYRLSLVTLRKNQVLSYEPFATGWLQGDTAWGRPVDTLVLPDGSLLVSDDYAGAIYRIYYSS